MVISGYSWMANRDTHQYIHRNYTQMFPLQKEWWLWKWLLSLMTQALHPKTERVWKRKLISTPRHTHCVGVALLSPSLYSPFPRFPSFRPKEHRDNNTPPCLSALTTHTHTPTTHAALHPSLWGKTEILPNINSAVPIKTGGSPLRSHVSIPRVRG